MRIAFRVSQYVVSWGLRVLALALIAVATLVPARRSTGAGGTPFWCMDCGDYALADAVANMALFVPLGWALARARVPLRLGVAVVVTVTLGVEWLQYSVVPGRDASLADALTNTVGGLVGMALPRLLPGIAASSGRALRGAALYGVVLVAALGAGLAMQAVQLPRALRWTEGSTQAYVPFSGALKTVSVGGAPVAQHEWHGVPTREVVEVAVALVSGRPGSGLAQIVVTWQSNEAGWMWLEQQDRDLRVHLSSASDRFRLRGHSLWLERAMPAMAGEPVTVRLVVRRFSYRIVVLTTGGSVVREGRITPADGWRLFTPFERGREPWAAVLTGSWMAVLLGPLGFLASARSRATAATAGVGAAVTLVLLPVVSGCAGLPLPGWCGAAGGFLLGSQQGKRGAMV